ncbi:hypothetical protein [Leifsonia sp. Leaf264]|uniref:hypothetical protein n=1 Tax=Leifsonia sp. Leaf264 TaxID=1736314 RepID=UPI0006F8D8A4|nr:hypothetical protein [Leifsonia sp. Leaf264]KQO98695.1 hypothetical protein ASF30_11575 [Leifsonia sp. Leaf264]
MDKATLTQPRVSAGAAGGHGGEWGNKHQSQANISLRPNPDARDARRRALIDDGYQPARITDYDGFSSAADWWVSHLALSETRKKGAYPKLPETNSASGRRTVVQRYAGPQVSIQMPSAAAIKKFSYDNGGTFDVPVTGTFPGGSVSGWVRVTQNALNEWSVQGLGFPDDNHQLVAEAVSAVLESRRPKAALADAGNLITRRMARFSAGGVRLEQPAASSTFIEAQAYDRDRSILAIKIRGKLYGYRAHEDDYRKFGNATSVGSAYNRLVRGGHRVDVVECRSCHRFSVAEATHRCPSKHMPAPSARRLAKINGN